MTAVAWVNVYDHGLGPPWYRRDLAGLNARPGLLYRLKVTLKVLS